MMFELPTPARGGGLGRRGGRAMFMAAAGAFWVVGLLHLCLCLDGRAAVAGVSDDVCVGDCDANGSVLINEVVTMVNAGLDLAPLSACGAGDVSGDGAITINEVIAALNRGLDGCLPCDFVLDEDVAVRCTGPGQECSPTFQATFALEDDGPVNLRYDAAVTRCSPLRLFLAVDGEPLEPTEFLGPEETAVVIRLGSLTAGQHRLEVRAEGSLGTCNIGRLAAWEGRVAVWPERCTGALRRRAALLAPPTPTPTPIAICDPVPRADCRQATNSTLVIRTGIKMLWKFKDPVNTGELGDPARGDTVYGLCVYDEIDGVPSLAAHAAVPAGGVCPFNRLCWEEKKSKLLYKDIGHRQEGVEKIVLKDSRIVFKVTGFRALPRPVDFVRFFYQESRVIAQVVNSEGFCWQGTFLPEHVGRNLPHVFRASKR